MVLVSDGGGCVCMCEGRVGPGLSDTCVRIFHAWSPLSLILRAGELQAVVPKCDRFEAITHLRHQVSFVYHRLDHVNVNLRKVGFREYLGKECIVDAAGGSQEKRVLKPANIMWL